MRKTLAALTVAAWLAGCTQQEIKPAAKVPARDMQDVSATAPVDSQTAWMNALEREIRKNDDWVVEEVQQDYTGVQETKHVKLRRLSKKVVEAMEKVGLVGFNAAYDEKKDVLLLPYAKSDKEQKEVLEAITHELWHALYDGEGVKGLMHDPRYNGPSREEIAAYCKQKTTSAAFEKLRSDMKADEEFENVKEIMKKIVVNYGSSLKSSTEKLKELKEDSLAHKTAEKYVDEKDKKAIADELNAIDVQSEKYIDAFVKFYDWFKEWNTKQGSRKEMLSLDEVAGLKDRLIKATQEFDKYTGLGERLQGLETKMQTVYDAAEDKAYEEFSNEQDKLVAKCKEDLAGAPEEQKKQMQEVIDQSKQCKETLDRTRANRREMRKTMRSLKDFSRSAGRFTMSSNAIIDKLVKTDNLSKIDKVLNDPNEVMARVVESLYDIYFGQVTQNQFPLGDQDLEFLGRFTLNGKKLFQKGLEKYRVGRRMVRAGFSQEKVREQLEYATRFTYDGRTYEWPAANFKITGHIPETK